MICEHILLITFFNKPELIFLPQLNGFKYCYLIWIILLTINYLFAHSELVANIAIEH